MTLIRRHALSAYSALALGYLFLPIAVVILFSFNNPAGRFNYTWQGFTLDSWLNPFGVPGLLDAMKISLEIAALSFILMATILVALLVYAKMVGPERLTG